MVALRDASVRADLFGAASSPSHDCLLPPGLGGSPIAPRTDDSWHSDNESPVSVDMHRYGAGPGRSYISAVVEDVLSDLDAQFERRIEQTLVKGVRAMEQLCDEHEKDMEKMMEGLAACRSTQVAMEAENARSRDLISTLIGQLANFQPARQVDASTAWLGTATAWPVMPSDSQDYVAAHYLDMSAWQPQACMPNHAAKKVHLASALGHAYSESAKMQMPAAPIQLAKLLG